ncbi:MAG: VacJ family lipoprotein [Desulfatitalea sp.]
MKTFYLLVIAGILITVGGVIGCAGSRQAVTPEAQTETAAPPTASDPSADTKPSAPGNTEEALLLEEDGDWADEPDENIYTVADPLEKFNRAVFYFNDKLYFWVMKPVAQGYRAVLPQPARIGVKNFFTNAAAPVRIVNNVLQGKGRAAEAEWAKFLYNTTVGVLGLGNPAGRNAALNPDAEDLGQTLAGYGIGDGFYIMWPFLGPSTLRDTAGMAGDRYINPVAYVEPWEAWLTVTATNQINNLSFRIGDYESLKKAALDPYESFRNAYIQLRQSKIKQ